MRKKGKKKIFFIVYLIVLLTILTTNHQLVFQIADSLLEQRTEEVKAQNIQYSKSEIIVNDIQLEFCPQGNCFNLLNDSFTQAQKSIECAFFEFDVEELSHTLVRKHEEGIEVELVIDANYFEEEGLEPIKNSQVKLVTDGTRSKLMHNKFCIIDDKTVITGSMNPTNNGINYNNNNLLKIDSKLLAINYKNEFDQLQDEVFGTKKKSTLEYNDIILLHNSTTSYHISSYFCPQDNCAKETLKVLNLAKNEILFANFVLTLDEIEELLLLKQKEGLNIKGVIESRSVRLKGSRVEALMENISIVRDSNPKTMHHKVFVVDEEYIITGSMNPSASGTKYNDENLLIIKNKAMALKYKKEILSIIQNGQ